MKYNLVIIFTLLAAVLRSQPILTSANMKFNVGEQYIYHSTDSLYSITGNGTPVAWDFSQLPSNSIQIVKIFSNTNPIFPNAQIEYNTAQESIYYDQSGDQIDLVGRQGATTLTCNNPQTIMKFPMNYFDSLSDAWNCDFTSGTSQFFRYGTRSAKGKWYGKAFTPLNQYNKVIRVDVKDHYKDSLVGVASFLIYQNNYTLFYEEGISLPVIILSDLNTSGVSKVGRSSYLQAVITSIENSDQVTIAEVTTYPNPATDYIDIKFNHDYLNKYTFILTDLLGRTIPFREIKITDDVIRIQPYETIHGYHLMNICSNQQIVASRKIYFQ